MRKKEDKKEEHKAPLKLKLSDIFEAYCDLSIKDRSMLKGLIDQLELNPNLASNYISRLKANESI